MGVIGNNDEFMTCGTLYDITNIISATILPSDCHILGKSHRKRSTRGATIERKMSQELIYLCYHNHPESRFSIFFWATFRPDWNQAPMFSTVFISMWKQHPKAFTCSNCFVSLKYIHPMFEFHDVAKKSRFFEFQTFSSRLLLTYSHCTFCGELNSNNLGISPFAWEEWQEVEKGKKRCWPHTTRVTPRIRQATPGLLLFSTAHHIT